MLKEKVFKITKKLSFLLYVTHPKNELENLTNNNSKNTLKMKNSHDNQQIDIKFNFKNIPHRCLNIKILFLFV